MIELNYNGYRKHVRAILFDMDGTIIDSMRWHQLAWSTMFKNHGIAISEEEIYKREGEKDKSTLTDILAKHNKKASHSEMEQMIDEKTGILKKLLRINLFPGIENFLKKTVDKGVKIILVTATSRPEMELLLPESVSSLFDEHITGDSVNKGKPNPEPYLKGLSAARVNNDDVIAIENAPLGITSAKNAGLLTIAIATTLPAEYLKEADIVVQSHDDFYGLFTS